LFELGLGDQVVAIDVTTTFPPEAAALPPVGFGQGFLAAEPVLGFEPTLVIGDIRIGPPEVLDQIRSAGVPVALIPYETQLSGIRTKIETVALLVGEEAAGAQLADRVDGEIAAAGALLAEVAETPGVAFLYARGPEALLLFGPGSPSSALINAAGAFDAVQGPPFGQLTPEALAAANPDVIITTEGALGALGGLEAFLALPGVSQTPAGAASRILAYDEALFLGLSPRAGMALRDLILELHPELAAG
jgi:iron complex transport system substrate-binding protein